MASGTKIALGLLAAAFVGAALTSGGGGGGGEPELPPLPPDPDPDPEPEPEPEPKPDPEPKNAQLPKAPDLEPHMGCPGGMFQVYDTDGDDLNVRAGPGTTFEILGDLGEGSIVKSSGYADGEPITKAGKTVSLWAYVPSQGGFLSMRYLVCKP